MLTNHFLDVRRSLFFSLSPFPQKKLTVNLQSW